MLCRLNLVFIDALPLMTLIIRGLREASKYFTVIALGLGWVLIGQALWLRRIVYCVVSSAHLCEASDLLTLKVHLADGN